MCFDETWTGEPLLQRAQDRVEPLDVTHLQNESPLRRQRGQFACVSCVFRNWLFNQKMFSALEKLTRNLEVRAGWSRNRSRIDGFNEFLQRAHALYPKLISDFLGSSGIGIVNGAEICAARFGIKPRMIFPDMTNPDDSYA